jgi:DNA-binding transcriptional regulator YhcF (GntR family)
MSEELVRQVVQEVVSGALRPLVEEMALLRAEVRALKHAMPNRLLPCREVAARVGVHPRTVKRRWEQGRIFGLKRGRRGLFFTEEEVERAIRAKVLP